MCETTICDNIRIDRFVGKAIDANSYIILEEQEALMFDAVDSDEMFSSLKGAGVKNVTVFLTHEHFDHISGLERLRRDFACRVIASVECGKRVQSPKTNLSSVADALISMQTHSQITKVIPEFVVDGADLTFDGDCGFAWHDHTIQCRRLCGHSPGSACYMLDGKMLFSGDELLAIPTITRFPGGSTQKYWKEDMPWFESIKSDIALVFPGHGKPGAMEEMLKANVMPEKFRRQEG